MSWKTECQKSVARAIKWQRRGDDYKGKARKLDKKCKKQEGKIKALKQRLAELGEAASVGF